MPNPVEEGGQNRRDAGAFDLDALCLSREKSEFVMAGNPRFDARFSGGGPSAQPFGSARVTDFENDPPDDPGGETR